MKFVGYPICTFLAITKTELARGFPMFDLVEVLTGEEARRAAKVLRRQEKRRRTRQRTQLYARSNRIDVHGQHRIIVRLTIFIPIEEYN